MAPALATDPARREVVPALSLHDPQFVTTLHAVAAKAHEALPFATGRIARAIEIVLRGGVTFQADGQALVQSQSHPEAKYVVNGCCRCADAATAPEGWCQHRMAVALLKRTQEALARTTEPPVDALPPVEDLTPAGLDRRFITHLHGKPFVRYAGLLALAHERGLVRLEARIEFHSDSLVLASATATFSDDRTFTEWSDATPSNVGAQVKPHWIRMALTRAKARALRDALNITLCCLEELDGE
jgi:hypothetical protein